MISFADDGYSAKRTSDALRDRGLDHVAVVQPLPPIAENGAPLRFALTAEAEQLLQLHPPDLALVDAPMLDSGASRLGTLDLLAPFLRVDLTMLLDDALCDAGLWIAASWRKRPDVSVHGIRATPKGLLEATLHSRVRTLARRQRRFLGRIRG